jgi:hypothetical protein
VQDYAKPNGVVAFPGGIGTNAMIERSRKAGIKIWTPAPTGMVTQRL